MAESMRSRTPLRTPAAPLTPQRTLSNSLLKLEPLGVHGLQLICRPGSVLAWPAGARKAGQNQFA